MGSALAACAVLALLLTGCDKFPYSYLGTFPSIPAATEFEVTSVLFTTSTEFGAGTVQMSGQYTALAAAPLPSTVQVFIRHTDAGGAVLAQVAFDLDLGPGGIIRNRLLPTSGSTLGPGHELRVVFRPVGAALPPGRLKLKLLYEKT